MSQNAAILQHLFSGNTITPAQAYELYGSLALHSRIAELRARGFKIDKKIQTANGKRWGEYSLVHND